MPPVRWKSSTVTIVCLLQAVLYTDGQIRQDDISSDGWKPIVGTRKPGFYESFPTDNSDLYKYEILSTTPPTVTALPPTLTPGPSRKYAFRGSPKPVYFSDLNFPGRKIPHQKHIQPDPFFALPTHQNHGPHIPLGAVVHTRPSQIGHIKQRVTSNKPFASVTPTNKRNVKPMRVQTSTSGYRDDIFTASATSGSYHYRQQPLNKIRTRETIDLGLPGNNHYSINQPHAHIEFTNRFALPSSESIFQQYNNPPIPAFLFGKHPQSNDINYQIPQIHTQNDFTRNLIPPPQIYKNNAPVNSAKPNIPENVVLQIPPTFQFAPPKINEPQVQVQVTKEKLHEFQNNIPSNYRGQYLEYDFSAVRKPTDAPQYDFSANKKPTEPPKPVYEVTEGKVWELPPQQSVRTRRPSLRPNFDESIPAFLPTPYKPEGQAVVPTSPTQSEVSTIFTKLSKLQREKEQTTPNPFSFIIKEVSTHYPIFGKPVFTELHSSQEISNDITTQQEEIITTTKEPQRVRPHRRRRPDHKRTTTTTTTESPVEVIQEAQEIESPQSEETERPIRIRRPTRYRTTTPSSIEETSRKITRGRNRYRHRNTELDYEPAKIRTRPARLETTTSSAEDPKSEESYQESVESQEAASERSEEIEENQNSEAAESELPEPHYVTETPRRVKYETIRPFIIITTTEKAPTTNLLIPENEVDVTEEVTSTTPEPTTTTATTTTTTANPHRIRTRPFKFDNSNRPRFSVKDYRQKLNLHSTTSTPELHRTTESARIRLPSRLRRPSTITFTNTEEESTEPVRSKFAPKEPRHSTTENTNTAIITERNVKSVNTRLRPFGRYKTTTATTTITPKVSIKPNLFSRKRPSVLTLRNKIHSKYQKNATEPTTEKATTTEDNEVRETTVDYEEEEEVEVASTTESNWRNIKTTEEDVHVETSTMGDISKIDPYFYSQRVSDLTSSTKNDYDTPGLFKSVSPTSRRIPNYFTISTDDPILPLEAFFTNIKDKKDKDS